MAAENEIRTVTASLSPWLKQVSLSGSITISYPLNKGGLKTGSLKNPIAFCQAGILDGITIVMRLPSSAGAA